MAATDRDSLSLDSGPGSWSGCGKRIQPCSKPPGDGLPRLDYFMYVWVGQETTTLSMASGTGMTDLVSGDWCWDLIDALAIDTVKLPELLTDRSRLLRSEYAKRWPPIAQAFWDPPLGDGACATIGCGVTDSTRVAMTLGTSGAVRVPLPRPTGTAVPLYDNLWTYRLDRVTAIYGAAISNGGLMLDWVRDLLGGDDIDLTAAAGRISPLPTV